MRKKRLIFSIVTYKTSLKEVLPLFNSINLFFKAYKNIYNLDIFICDNSPLSYLQEYQKLFEIEGIILTFDRKAIDIIVNKAIEFNLGARGLRSICETIMLDLMYNAPSDKSKKEVRITATYAKNQISKLPFTNLDAA